MVPVALFEPDSDGKAISSMSLVGWDLNIRAIVSSAVLGAMEATPKLNSCSVVRMRQLEVLGDEEMSVATGAPNGEVSPGALFGSLPINVLTY